MSNRVKPPPSEDHIKEIIEATWDRLCAEERIHLSVDFIAYTEQYELFYSRVTTDLALTRHEVFMVLMNLRKNGKCPAPNGRRRTQRA